MTAILRIIAAMLRLAGEASSERLLGLVTGGLFVFFIAFANTRYGHESFFDVFHHARANHGVATLASWPYIEVVEPSRQDANDTTWPYRVFKTEEALTPPNLTIAGNGGPLSDGHLFLNIKNRSSTTVGQKQRAPFIIGTDNELVYGLVETDNSTNNFQVQQLHGQPHLTLWSGDTTMGHGYGQVIILDSSYHQTNVTLDAGVDVGFLAALDEVVPCGTADFHEQTITSRGTVLVTAYNNTPYDLTQIGGRADSWVTDSMIFEIDIATGDVVFSWSALDHIPVKASNMPLISYQGDGKSEISPWDHMHINSIQDLPEGLLVSGRHTWSVYLISRVTGEIIWTLDGSGFRKGSWDSMPANGHFSWQHHARIVRQTESSVVVSIFDNHGWREDIGHHPSRGLMFELPMPPDKNKRPRVISDIQSTLGPGFYSDSQGSFDAALPNGNMLLGYGPIPVIHEFGPGDTGNDLRWEGRFGDDNKAMSYRVFKHEWHATPYWDPKLVIEKLDDAAKPQADMLGAAVPVRGYVSWNGATDVDEWYIYLGNGKEEELIGKASRKGFETAFDLRMRLNDICVQAAALQNGKQIRRSNTICL